MATAAAAAARPLAFPSLRWDLDAAGIAAAAARVISHSTTVLDAVAAAATAPTFETVLAPLARLDRDIELDASATFLRHAHTDSAVRDAASAAHVALESFSVAAGMRLDVYAAVKALAAKAPALEPEWQRFLERSLRDYRRRGLDLDEATRERVKELRTRVAERCEVFTVGVANATAEKKLYFTEAALRGMPAPFVAGLRRAADEEATSEGSANRADVAAAIAARGSSPAAPWLEVTLAYPHVVPLLKLAAEPATRAAVERAFNSRAHPSNTAVLEEIVLLRQQLAGLLGAPSHAAYVLEERMAKDAGSVARFLADLGTSLVPLLEADLARLRELQVAEEGPESRLTMADYRYFMERDLATTYQVDHDAVRAYFPLHGVVTRMLAMYERMLGLRFIRQPVGTYPSWLPADCGVPPEDVSLYRVVDASESSASGGGGGDADAGVTIGWFYLDMHPRPGKYSHAAVFPLVSGCAGDAPGERVLPICAMLCNFPKPTASEPSLLRHEEVVTLFHEFGHVTHCLCSRTVTARFSAFNCELDVVEAPSQMLENWCWEPATLQALSGHHEDESRKLPLDLAEKLQRSKRAHAGLFNTRQVLLASFDQALHSLPAIPPTATPETLAEARAAIDSGALLRGLHDSLLRIPMTPGTNFAASFGHLVGGYDSGYYGYLWSEVFAADMFAAVFKADPLSPVAGKHYRDTILAAGGSVDAAVFLRRFLGREPSNEAFLRSKGLGTAAGSGAV